MQCSTVHAYLNTSWLNVLWLNIDITVTKSFCIFKIIRQSGWIASQKPNNNNNSVLCSWVCSWVCTACLSVMTVHSISEQQHVYTPALIITRVYIPLHCYIKFPVQCPLPSQQISDGKIDSTTAQGSSYVGFWLASAFLSYYVPKVSLCWYIFLLSLVTYAIHSSLQWHEQEWCRHSHDFYTVP